MQPGNRRYPHWAREPHGGNRGGQDKGKVEGEGSRLAVFKSRLSSAEEALAAPALPSLLRPPTPAR
ncbi:rCG34683 [Rattus norvegicus]|uniref:RCG34683 n=1 Tax=Rattus norvegicus TaxID=10116 RepID=A6HIE4_RAT|nr:rCG34683 [Rattus norvegicus]